MYILACMWLSLYIYISIYVPINIPICPPFPPPPSFAGDIKPENILMVSKDVHSTVKLTDFGFAARCYNDHCLTETCGSPSYVAPEILSRTPYGRPADIWSLGVVGYILLCGYTPFDAKSDKHMYTLIKAGRYQFHSDAWGCVSEEAKDLLSHMLVVDPAKRYTAQQALDHPWVRLDYLCACVVCVH